MKATRDSCDSARPMLPHEGQCQRKRRRDQSFREDIEEEPRAKRRKGTSYNYPPEFWNVLSKITLTRRVLKEFDRRTTEEKTILAVGVAKRSTRLLRSDKKRLFCFAKNGGPNLSYLRGYATIPHSLANMGKSSSWISKRTRNSGLPSNESTKGTSTTGPYNAQFQQMLTDKGVYPDGYEDLEGNIQEPENIDSIRELLHNSRSSLSPSSFTDDVFRNFQRANRRAKSELKAISTVVPIITGPKDNRFETEENILFNNLEKFALGLRMAQPDKYYGARLEQADERVCRDLHEYIIPSTSTTLPVLPNFFIEGKSAAGRPDVAQRQVMHDNAYGARGMFQLQNYGKDTPVYDGNAYTIGSSYCDGTLKLYATHPKRSATGDTEYHMAQLGGYQMTGDVETCRRGIAAYRNARDFTQQKRDQFITDANAIAQRRPIVATPSSWTSADELDVGYAVSFANHDSSEPERYRVYKHHIKRLLGQGHSKKGAFEHPVQVPQQSQQVAKKTAVTQVRAIEQS